MKKDLEKKYFSNKKVKVLDKKSKYNIGDKENLTFVGYKNDKVLFRGEDGKIVEANISEPIQVMQEGGVIQVPYYSASEVCMTLDTLVPAKMSQDQRKYNEYLKTAVVAKYGLTVEQYVAEKLNYKSVDDLCYDPTEKDDLGNRKGRFAQEQIDAIATSIWNHEENGVAIIVADQTGVGKGRTGAGILRYCYFNKITPMFFTEKKHLINDIYRDLVDIGFACNVVQAEYIEEVVIKDEWTEEEVVAAIKKDYDKDDKTLSLIDFEIDQEILEYWDGGSKKEITIEDVLNYEKKEEKEDLYARLYEEYQRLIEEYEQELMQKGQVKTSYKKVDQKTIDKQAAEQVKQGRVWLEPCMPSSFPDITDSDGNIIYYAPKKKDWESLQLKKQVGKKWEFDYEAEITNEDFRKKFNESKYKALFLTYSQINKIYTDNKRIYETPKVMMIKALAQGCGVVLDESHNAAGGGENSSQTYQVLEEIVRDSDMTTYVSATFAKTENNMPIYSIGTSIKEAGLTTSRMIRVFAQGGDSLKEAVSSELVRNGQLVRREKKIQGKSEYKLTSNFGAEYVTEEVSKLDAISNIWKQIIKVDKTVRAAIKEIKKQSKEVEIPGYYIGTKEEFKNTVSIKSSTWRLFNFFLLGLKINPTVTESLNRLRNGRKVIIAIANTMESALKTMPKDMTSKKVYELGDEIQNNFVLYLKKTLRDACDYKVVDQNAVSPDSPNDIPYIKSNVLTSNDRASTAIKDFEGFKDAYDTALAMIENISTRISVSPIDEIKQKLSNEGYKVEEVTGRQRQITFSNDEEGNMDFTKGIVSRRKARGKTEIIKDFNENKVDVLILNQSGSTGVSMHPKPMGQAQIVYDEKEEKVIDDNGVEKTIFTGAPTSLEPKTEVKKRCMIITQMELNINTEVQKLGRINRTGQVYTPEYCYITSTIASEGRINAMTERKLRSLMSNVSANQSQSKDIFTSDDLFSSYGAEALNFTLELYLKELKDNNIGITGDVTTGAQVKDFLKVLYFVNYDLQRNIYNTLTRKLQEVIQQAKDNGSYTGELSYKDYKAKTLAQTPLYIGNEKSKTSFGRHVVLEEAEIQVAQTMNTYNDVVDKISSNVKAFYDKIININIAIEEAVGDFYTEADKKTIKSIMLNAKKPIAKGEDFLGGSTKEVTLSTFKADFKEYSDMLEERAKNEMERMSNASRSEIKRLEEDSNSMREALRDFEGLEDYLEKEKELEDANESLYDLEKRERDALSNRERELATELTNQKFDLLDKIDELKKFIEENELKFEEAKRSSRQYTRQIDRNDREIERETERIERYENGFKQEKLVLKKANDVCSSIGKLCFYKFQEIIEETDYDTYIEEINEYKKNYSYKTIKETEGVLVGVKLMLPTESITAGKVTIDFSSARKEWDETTNLSRTLEFRKDRHVQDNVEPAFTFTEEDHYYFDKKTNDSGKEVNMWQEVAGNTELVTTEKSFFLIGTPLKSSSISAKNKNFEGNVVKYTDENNKEKLAIEVKRVKNSRGEDNYNNIEIEYFLNGDGVISFSLNEFNFEKIFLRTCQRDLLKYKLRQFIRNAPEGTKEELTKAYYIDAISKPTLKLSYGWNSAVSDKNPLKDKPGSIFVTEASPYNAIYVAYVDDHNFWQTFSEEEYKEVEKIVQEAKESYLSQEKFQDLDGTGSTHSPSLDEFENFMLANEEYQKYITLSDTRSMIETVCYSGELETIQALAMVGESSMVTAGTQKGCEKLGIEDSADNLILGHSAPFKQRGSFNIKDGFVYVSGNSRDIKLDSKVNAYKNWDSIDKENGILVGGNIFFKGVEKFEDTVLTLASYGATMDCSTTMRIVDSVRDLFVFEQFTDNLVAVDDNSEDETRFLPTEQGNDEVINKMIDELVKII